MQILRSFKPSKNNETQTLQNMQFDQKPLEKPLEQNTGKKKLYKIKGQNSIQAVRVSQKTKYCYP